VAVDRSSIARRGEDAAADYLVRHDLTIIDRNWRCRAGEIDIVALDGKTIVFCEVKTRRSLAAGTPEEAVDRRKQRRIVRLAEHYLGRAGLEGVDARFDVIAIEVSCGKALLRHHRGAFARS
jgi:putative endonuclease